MKKSIEQVEFIFFVSDQEVSKKFYKKMLRKDPVLDVPGMTEFLLLPTTKLGLMPNTGIAKILDNKTLHPEMGNGIPRCELYLYVDDVELEFSNAINCGATLISLAELRDWGDKVCYFADPDGHIIAFAQKQQQ